MANAKKFAPLSQDGDVATEQEPRTKEEAIMATVFDPEKRYMFELAKEAPERALPVWDMRANRPAVHRKYKPFQNIVYTSQVVWNGNRRMLRYYDGCTTIFADEQPRDKESLEQFIAQTQKRAFRDGKFGCYGYERMLLLYLLICSWNGESQFKTKTSSTIFRPVDQEKKATAESLKLDETERALGLAKEASVEKMLIHADYLGIPTMDYDSGNELLPSEIRTAYRKEALRDSKNFIESYGNKALEMKYYINKALEKGLIHNTRNPNKASWQGSNNDICDISGLKSQVSIAQKIFEFSQLTEGEEFCIQLRALFN